jgi:hypothetical protein
MRRRISRFVDVFAQGRHEQFASLGARLFKFSAIPRQKMPEILNIRMKVSLFGQDRKSAMQMSHMLPRRSIDLCSAQH